jgi:hypothetical protein
MDTSCHLLDRFHSMTKQAEYHLRTDCPFCENGCSCMSLSITAFAEFNHCHTEFLNSKPRYVARERSRKILHFMNWNFSKSLIVVLIFVSKQWNLAIISDLIRYPIRLNLRFFIDLCILQIRFHLKRSISERSVILNSCL